MDEEEVALLVKARKALLNRIAKSGGGNALRLAEAYAWLSNASQPHGGSVTVSK